ncbi:DUF3888 domain-containing protein [Alicyclobacillus fastidiosus]|uniref:DUF3888 domain-containing protein n=1 Tax=Alicyclobacillus fastidiosus TaxID=392011 RepID=UPI0034D4968C
MPVCTVNAQPVLSQERIKDNALVALLLPQLNEAVHEQFACERVVGIRQLRGGNREFEIRIQVVTHTGPHNPPNDLVTVMIERDLSGLHITDVQRTKNLSSEQVRERCAH